jgi:predicted nucleic-acid-binding protein
MIALDTNVIARFYVDDPTDLESQAQRPLARSVFESTQALFVPLTVMLELEWVMRAFYDFSPAQFGKVVRHLAGLPHVTLESASTILSALQDHLDGLDFADALHLRASSACEAFVSFDDRKFARRAAKLKLQPAVIVPAE